jgi:hypothetical protein
MKDLEIMKLLQSENQLDEDFPYLSFMTIGVRVLVFLHFLEQISIVCILCNQTKA